MISAIRYSASAVAGFAIGHLLVGALDFPQSCVAAMAVAASAFAFTHARGVAAAIRSL